MAGVDEAGRGPLAGPVVAAAVILDELQPIVGLNDSKTISPRRRERLFDEIRAKALCVSIAEASVEEIDALNILQATMLAMRRAVEGLRLLPRCVLVDGNRLPPLKMPAEAIVKGDAKVAAISAASILAKVQRDRLCLALHERWPDYGFDGHKGYPTPEHLEALAPARRLPGAPAQLRAGARGAGVAVSEPTAHPLARQPAARPAAPAGAGRDGLPPARRGVARRRASLRRAARARPAGGTGGDHRERLGRR